MLSIPIRIVSAANKYVFKDSFFVLMCLRHCDSFTRDAATITGLNHQESKIVQGFVDNKGNFHTRQEAWKIAEEQNQILRRVGGDDSGGGTLYSENLY